MSGPSRQMKYDLFREAVAEICDLSAFGGASSRSNDSASLGQPNVHLRQLGLKVPAKGKEPELKMEILFLSYSARCSLIGLGFPNSVPGTVAYPPLRYQAEPFSERCSNSPFRGMDDFKRWGGLQLSSQMESSL